MLPTASVRCSAAIHHVRENFPGEPLTLSAENAYALERVLSDAGMELAAVRDDIRKLLSDRR